MINIYNHSINTYWYKESSENLIGLDEETIIGLHYSNLNIRETCSLVSERILELSRHFLQLVTISSKSDRSGNCCFLMSFLE